MKESFTLMPVRPVKPVAPWVGGKRALSSRLVEMISRIDHKLYAEPFVGMGGVFFRRKHRPVCEVINDRSRDVANLFRILQRHYQQFMDTLKWQLSSRAEFDRLMKVDPDTMTDLERAARFLYLQRLSFGGTVDRRTFGVSYTNGARFDLTKLGAMLEDVHERLSGVIIECRPYEQMIRQYDRPGALFYCDPPYWGCTDDYGKDLFSEADFGRLRDVLATLQGAFILSINDTPEIRDIFAGFTLQEVTLNYRRSGAVTPAKELIITGP